MYSSPHWQVGLSPANREQRLSRWADFAKIVSRKLGPRSCHDLAKNIALLGAKKWGPTYDRDISNSAIYTTAIYREYTVHDTEMVQGVALFPLRRQRPVYLTQPKPWLLMTLWNKGPRHQQPQYQPHPEYSKLNTKSPATNNKKGKLLHDSKLHNKFSLSLNQEKNSARTYHVSSESGSTLSRSCTRSVCRFVRRYTMARFRLMNAHKSCSWVFCCRQHT